MDVGPNAEPHNTKDPLQIGDGKHMWRHLSGEAMATVCEKCGETITDRWRDEMQPAVLERIKNSWCRGYRRGWGI